MDEKGLKPEDIKTLKDVAKLPFTMKKDLRDTYPYGLFAVDMSEVVRLHASSGTTGKPIVVGYTKEDMDVWAQVVKRGLLACGFRSTDIVQNFYGYGLFTGGLGIHGGFEALGATVIPISGGNTERQVMLMKDFGVTAVGGTPSYFVRIIDVAEKMGVNIRDLKVKRGIFGAEPWSDGMRDYIEEKTGIKAYDIYGLSEIVGPGVGCECECRDGIHIFEDHFYPEIVDPETLSTPKSSTPKRWNRCRTAKKANSCSLRSASARCPSSATAPATLPLSRRRSASAAEPSAASAALAAAATT